MLILRVYLWKCGPCFIKIISVNSIKGTLMFRIFYNNILIVTIDIRFLLSRLLRMLSWLQYSSSFENCLLKDAVLFFFSFFSSTAKKKLLGKARQAGLGTLSGHKPLSTTKPIITAMRDSDKG